MDTEKYSDGPCPIARALCRIGDAWSMMILRDAGSGATRFDQFQKNLGIAPNILTRRLVALTESGLLERRRYSDHPPRDDYVLTAAGWDFLPVLYALGAWGGRNFGDDNFSRLVDAESGREVEIIVVDRATGNPITARDQRVESPDAP
ncbi:MAG: transcriptional regulator, HxlR family [Sphingomonas bacterium]|jgi:DNA-binding HxlR family transcriptional regulator|uniref:winged helix-turn-helix transcriptional regulator n=1 Tax=Sphingomonas bacterium TaxID=1895847 RepID=UPI00260950BA|nr:helix-turn-helix domain-containing protein [Sphingomonas bacterium]MDB5703497.1 transcriptional regulator, HxlR family [Sphingomonas bacterium]